MMGLGQSDSFQIRTFFGIYVKFLGRKHFLSISQKKTQKKTPWWLAGSSKVPTNVATTSFAIDQRSGHRQASLATCFFFNGGFLFVSTKRPEIHHFRCRSRGFLPSSWAGKSWKGVTYPDWNPVIWTQNSHPENHKILHAFVKPWGCYTRSNPITRHFSRPNPADLTGGFRLRVQWNGKLSISKQKQPGRQNWRWIFLSLKIWKGVSMSMVNKDI